MENQHKRSLCSDASQLISWEEQDRLFDKLPTHLRQMALFAVNTGCRDQEICHLRWDWEVAMPDLDLVAFIVPGARVKNGDDRLIVCNDIALNLQVRVHDLKHTFGSRLRAAGVSFEGRQDLLGHRSSRITTHYSSAELHNLQSAANKICEAGQGRVTLSVLRRVNRSLGASSVAMLGPANSPQGGLVEKEANSESTSF